MAMEDLIKQCCIWEGQLSGLVDRAGKPRAAKQIELADALGFSQPQINHLKTGRVAPSVTLIQQIAERYNKSWNTIQKLYER